MTLFKTLPNNRRYVIKINDLKKNDSCPMGLLQVKRAYNKAKKVHILDILESSGIQYAIWALRLFPCKKYYEYLIMMIELIALPIWETRYQHDLRPREACDSLCMWINGKISRSELNTAMSNALAAATSEYTKIVNNAGNGENNTLLYAYAAYAVHDFVSAIYTKNKDVALDTIADLVSLSVDECDEFEMWNEIKTRFTVFVTKKEREWKRLDILRAAYKKRRERGIRHVRFFRKRLLCRRLHHRH